MTFENFNLDGPILRALQSEGYTEPTPIQEQAIPILLNNKDLLGCAQTGTGKTAAFSIPIIQWLLENPADPNRARQIRALILAPTRELAAQIGQNFNSYARFTSIRSGVIFGGVPQSTQEYVLRKGIDVLIATPGRLLDLLGQGYLFFGHLKWLVLDEADLMLDMGFIPDIRRIIRHLPEERQTIFLSATMPPEAVKLSKAILKSPEKVDVTEQVSSADSINQTVFMTAKADKPALLVRILRKNAKGSALIFTRTKTAADRVARALNRAGIAAEAIHGNKTQTSRTQSLRDFKSKRTSVMVATDIAARGIDVSNLSMVINFELPNVPEMYIHRIGRTGRAGAGGRAISFCDPDEIRYLKAINKLLPGNIPVADENRNAPTESREPQKKKKPESQTKGNNRQPLTLVLRKNLPVAEEHSV